MYGFRLFSALNAALVFTSLLVVSARGATGQATPVGLWNTISDRDGRPTGVVEIREIDGGEYIGIVRGILIPATHDDSVCGKCAGALKNAPVVGMTILRHMHRDGDQWSGGEILDPENGKVYRATMRLADGGKKLIVRGYVGISLFGRSQTWMRRE
jgi:uncharacterized protein (DUF2147 family)